MISRSNKYLIVIAAFMLFLTVAMGAFGAHALASIVSEKMIETWEKAVDYLAIHGLALLALAVLMPILANSDKFLKIPAVLMIIGTILFSGSLFMWVLTEIKWLVFITPLGGTILLIAWGWLLMGALKLQVKSEQAE